MSYYLLNSIFRAEKVMPKSVNGVIFYCFIGFSKDSWRIFMTLNLAVEVTGSTINIIMISIDQTFIDLELLGSIHHLQRIFFKFSSIALKSGINFVIFFDGLGHV